MDGKLLGDLIALPILLALYGLVRCIEWLM